MNGNSPKNTTTRLGILLSGRGSNFLAIAQSIREGRLPGVEIAIVISNLAHAPGLAAARRLPLDQRRRRRYLHPEFRLHGGQQAGCR